MKKTIIALLALMPMALMAQTPRADYNRLSPYPTPAQVANPQVRAEKQAFYEAFDAEMETKAQAAAQSANASAKALQAQANKQMQQQNNATGKQKQAQQQMAGDMMQIIQSLGIPMEQLAEMSEEEIEALVRQKAMPQMTQNTGLTPAEMEMLSKMSDREAEAYMKAHPEVMARYQNSRYGQQADELRGMEQMQEASDADQALFNRIFEINHETTELSTQWMRHATQLHSPNGAMRSREFADNFFAPYDERISDLVVELQTRFEKEHPADGSYPMPAYGKSYYDRINAIVDEANLELAKQWCKGLNEQLNEYREQVEALLPLYEEQQKLYDQIKDPAVRQKAAAHMITSQVYRAIQAYVFVLKDRLDAPFMDYIEMPKTIDVCINCQG